MAHRNRWFTVLNSMVDLSMGIYGDFIGIYGDLMGFNGNQTQLAGKSSTKLWMLNCHVWLPGVLCTKIVQSCVILLIKRRQKPEIIDSGPSSGGVYSEDGMMLVYSMVLHTIVLTHFSTKPLTFFIVSVHTEHTKEPLSKARVDSSWHQKKKTHEAPKKDVAGSSEGRQHHFFKRGIDPPTGHVDEKIMTQWMELGFYSMQSH